MLIDSLERLDGRRTIRFVPGVPPEIAAQWVEEYEPWFGSNRRLLAGAEENPALARVESPLGPLVAKRAPLPRLRSRRSRSERGFTLGRTWCAAGLCTPEPLAWIEDRRLARSVLITRWVNGRDPWSFLADENDSRPPWTALVSALAGSIAGLHARGFRHRDLKAPNLLVRRGETGIEVWFVDLDGAGRLLSRIARARDLARLCVSFRSTHARNAGVRADAWPALVAGYAERAGLSSADSARILGWTELWAERHIERNLRLGRPIA